MASEEQMRDDLTATDYEWRLNLLKSARPYITLGMIFRPDGSHSTESRALTRIAIVLLFSQHFGGNDAFGDWSFKEDLASIDPQYLLRLTQTSSLKEVSCLSDTTTDLISETTIGIFWSRWQSLQALAEVALYKAISVLTPLYRPIQVREIRLLRILPEKSHSPNSIIKCELVNLSIDTPFTPYDCLSYCWGPPGQEQRAILVDGHQHEVNETLHHILRHFRHSSRLLWIDALCINQTDLQEKSVQIPLMGDIYSGAAAVHIWLGPDEQDSSYVLNCIRSSKASEKRQPRFLVGLYHVLTRPWFNRVWIAQELVLAAPGAPILMSGTGHVSWQLFANYIRVWTPLESYPLVNPPLGRKDLEESMECLGIMITELDIVDAIKRLLKPLTSHPVFFLESMRERYWEDDMRSLPLPAIWMLMRGLQSSDPKDKVYGSLGMTGFALNMSMNRKMIVDYSNSVSQIFRDSTIAAISFESPVVYSAGLYQLPIKGEHPNQSEESPSWSFDFSFVGTEHADPLMPGDIDIDTRALTWTHEPSMSDHTLDLTASLVDCIFDIISAPPNVPREKCARLRPWHASVASLTIDEYVDMEKAYDTAKATRKRHKAIELKEYKLFLLEVKSRFQLATARRQCKPSRSKSLWQILFAEDKSKRNGRYSKALEALTTESVKSISVNETTEAVRDFLSPEGKPPYSFFTTQTGLCGLCTTGAQQEDELVMLFRGESGCEVPFVIRRKGARAYSMITVAYVQSDWEKICDPHDAKRFRFV